MRKILPLWIAMIILSSLAACGIFDGSGDEKDNPENEQPPAAPVLLSFLESIQGTHCLTGQHAGRAYMGNIDNVYEKTGTYPAVVGFDVGIYNTTKGTPAYAGILQTIANEAASYHDQGGIVTMSWHWIPPDLESGTYNSTKGIFDIEAALQADTPEHNQLLRDMDEVAEHVLIPLRDKNVPVMWRPFHEASGGWFWWSKSGKDNLIELWKLMYDRYMNHHELDNLLWVFSFAKDPAKWGGWYPGHDYVDILGTDVYVGRNHLDYASDTERFERLQEIGGGKPCAYAETDMAPNVDSEHQWVWFLVWHGDYADYMSKSKYNQIYHSDTFLSREELTDLKP